MIIVLPVCFKDSESAIRNLAWARTLDQGKVPFDCLLTHDDSFDPSKVIKAAKDYFQAVRVCKYPACKFTEWPRPQNWAFTQSAGWVLISERQPFLWWEQDAIPLKQGWLSALKSEYEKSGKAFIGARSLLGMPHLSGVAVYPFNVSIAVNQIQMNPHIPFDIAGGKLVLDNAKITPLIQHVWSWKGNGKDDPAPVFTGKDDLDRIDKEAVIFHRCKDGSLVSLLSNGTNLQEAIQKAKPSLIQVLMRWKHGKGKWLFQRSPKRTVRITVTLPEPKLIHCLERHKQNNPDAERRVLQAQESWITLYKTGQVLPAHVWEPSRNSEQIGDARCLPYFKDVLLAGLNGGNRNDFVFWTNDDSILHPKLPAHLMEVLTDKPAVSSYRINFDKGSIPSLDKSPGELLGLSRALNPPGDIDLGRDLFAFRKDWLRDHWHNIPDFLLGELEFDLVMAFLIRKYYGIQTTKTNMDVMLPECELQKGYVIHERHNRSWTLRNNEAAPAKAWNRKLATEFYCDNDLHSLITNKL